MIILITGPQGSGKTMEAHRLASLLVNQSYWIFDEMPTQTTISLMHEDVLFITTNAPAPEWLLKEPNLIHFTVKDR